jgi:proteasome accessory factor A
MDRLFGIETEYGIVVEGLGANDWIAESIGVVRSCPIPSVGGWNYRGEDPRRDMRGFTVEHLSTNPDDAQFDPPGAPVRTREEERSDRILSNGARFYNDHGHPEYSTPECRSLKDLVAHDKAGERIAFASAQKHAKQRNRAVSLYKNNTDFHGASYGTHEGYLMKRDVPTDVLIQSLLPFFATRQIYAGAGKVGVENDSTVHKAPYQISQRADYFSVEASVDTLHNRPLVNTRDEPHATPRHYRRLHVICGDANMSEYATALKVGTTALVLQLLERGLRPAIRLAHPIAAAKQVSRDITLKKTLECAASPSMTAIEIQWLYQQEAERQLAGQSEEMDWVLQEWSAVLKALETNISSLADRLDWVAKYQLLNDFREGEGLKWSDPYLQSLDLAYHDIDPEQGLFYGLEQAGAMRRIVTEAHICSAMTCPPSNTRAFLRGQFVSKFPQAIRSIGWNGVAFQHKGNDFLFDMNPLVEENVKALNEEISAAESLEAVIEIIQKPVDETTKGE